MVDKNSYLQQLRPGGIRRFALKVKDWNDKEQKTSVRWYLNQIQKLNVNSQKFLMREQRAEGIDIGDMYYFRYVAKHRDTLPYWDSYPMIFPFNILPDGFMGLNLHYVHPVVRAVLLDSLESVSKKKDAMAINWQILKGASQQPYIRHTVKRYLFSQVSSHFVKIEKRDWMPAMLMPLQQFHGASAEKVWSEAKQ